MKVVLDTNVVVSAFLSPDGKPAAILRLVLRGDLKACFSTVILAEYEQVLCRSKFAGKVNQSAIRRFFDLLHDIGNNIIPTPGLIPMSDETDRIFYDAAKTAGAVLITGNKKHYPDEPQIQSPSEFLDQYFR